MFVTLIVPSKRLLYIKKLLMFTNSPRLMGIVFVLFLEWNFNVHCYCKYFQYVMHLISNVCYIELMLCKEYGCGFVRQ